MICLRKLSSRSSKVVPNPLDVVKELTLTSNAIVFGVHVAVDG